MLKDWFTNTEKTWCPGCPNYSILIATAKAFDELNLDKKNLVITAGIGCHGKIFDYLKVNGYYGLHGRALSLGIGIKLANPKLNVITFAGDGDMYDEGISHFIHASRYNPNVTLIVHNNKVFALTTGQHTATTEEGFKSKSLNRETFEKPLNPILLALVNHASFVARAYALDIKQLTQIIKEAIKHKGFSFIDVIQPCITFHDFREYIEKRKYYIEEPLDLDKAIEKAKEWNYELDENIRKIPFGIFYKNRRKTLEEYLEVEEWYKIERKYNDIKEIYENFKC